MKTILTSKLRLDNKNKNSEKMKQKTTSKSSSFQYLFTTCLLIIFSSATPTFATTYYVDNNIGNDLNSGLSPGSPWQTLTKVNSFLFSPNDSILFIRNGVWRGQLIPKGGTTAGSITYADYGSGAKPLLLGSLNKTNPNDWIDEGANIWRCAQIFTIDTTEYVVDYIDSVGIVIGSSKIIDVGNIIFNNGSSCGIKKWNQSDLLTQGDYWFDRSTGNLKIYSADNPAYIYSDIECARRIDGVYIKGQKFLNIKNLAVKYMAGTAFKAKYTNNIRIQGCEMSYIGGGDLNQDGSNIRFGNGVTFWAGNHDDIVEQCKIWEIYDVGVTNQNQNNTVEQYNIYYRNNIIYNCALASFEYWNKPASSYTGNIHFENNTCIGAGLGWGTQRPDRVGAHILLSYNEAETDSIFIRNNIFYKANVCLAMPETWNTTDGYSKLVLSNNLYYQPLASDTLAFLFYSEAYNTGNFSAYQANTGQDINSLIANPLFVDESNNDYHITSVSPCIDQGCEVNILNDFDNDVRLPTSIDIGADEYH